MFYVPLFIPKAYETEKTNAIESAVENAKLNVIHDKDLEIKNLTSKLKEEFENEKQVSLSFFKYAFRTFDIAMIFYLLDI